MERFIHVVGAIGLTMWLAGGGLMALIAWELL